MRDATGSAVPCSFHSLEGGAPMAVCAISAAGAPVAYMEQTLVSTVNAHRVPTPIFGCDEPIP